MRCSILTVMSSGRWRVTTLTGRWRTRERLAALPARRWLIDGLLLTRLASMATDFVACARPGHRAPHLAVRVNGEECSTLDLFGDRFTLLCGQNASVWHEVSDPRVSVVSIGDSSCDAQEQIPGAFESLYGLGPDGCVLVRPDGHVCLRLNGFAVDRSTAITSALDRILGLALGRSTPGVESQLSSIERSSL
jgi:hypothetical protein